MLLIFGLFGLKVWWEKWFTCVQFDKIFTYEDNLNKHMQSNPTFENIQEKWCTFVQNYKAFYLENNLNKHGQCHTAEISFVVPTNFSCLSAMCKACYDNGHLTVHEPEQQISKLLCLFLSSYQSHQSKAKRSLTWPLYGLFGLENPIIINGV